MFEKHLAKQNKILEKYRVIENDDETVNIELMASQGGNLI